MEDNNINQNADPAADQGAGGKTFTQEDVNRIVGERLAKEKAKNTNETDLAKREQELAQRELKLLARETLSSKGLPAELLDALNCSDKETMEKSIGTVEKIFNEYKANATRQIKFRGFQPGASSDKPPKITEDQQIREAMRLRT